MWTSRVFPTRWALLVTACMLGCDNAIGLNDSAVATHRSVWESQGLSSYEYDLVLTDVAAAFANQRLRIVVRQDTVESATYAATGAPVTGNTEPWPTIDALFDLASSAAASDDLLRTRFDAHLGYPLEVMIKISRDERRSYLASDLQPLP